MKWMKERKNGKNRKEKGKISRGKRNFGSIAAKVKKKCVGTQGSREHVDELMAIIQQP